MKIVMLGHNGVGKSTYMASVYGAMQERPFDLRLKVKGSGEHKRLLDEASKLRGGIYPPATSQRQKYDFDLQYAGHEPIPFEWTDYRGGDLYLTSGEAAAAAALHTDIDDADGLLVFCDSPEIYNGRFDHTDLGHMVSLLTSRLARQEDPLFVAVLLTKSDAVPEFNQEMIECFEGLIDTVNASQSVIAGFVPVACGVRPANVVPALCFALTGAIYIMGLRQQLKVKQIERLRADMERRNQGMGGFFDRLLSPLVGEPTWEELAREKALELATEQGELERIAGVLSAISQSLDAVSWFDAEKDLDDYVAEVSRSAASALESVKRRVGSAGRSFF